MNTNARTIFPLLAIYLIWGSTYLVIRYAIEDIPPLLMAGSRFLIAGGLLTAFLKLRGTAWPAPKQWGSAVLIGTLMLAGGNGAVTFAEQWVASGLAAVMVSTVPLWVAIWVGLFGKWPSRIEWMGLILGFSGVILLNLEGNLRANPLGAVILLLAPVCWSLGSALSRRIDVPTGAMGFAIEMLAGGVVCLVLGFARGEQVPAVVSAESLTAWLYLIVFGSLIAFSCYMYLLKTVPPALATSYAYVNPIVAVVLGIVIANEPITRIGLASMVIIVCSVILLTFAKKIEGWIRPKQMIKAHPN